MKKGCIVNDAILPILFVQPRLAMFFTEPADPTSNEKGEAQLTAATPPFVCFGARWR
jgi:hypothetical protein